MLPQRVYAKIDLDAICQNIKNAMDKVGKETKIMAIIKTDAYGHGAVPSSSYALSAKTSLAHLRPVSAAALSI